MSGRRKTSIRNTAIALISEILVTIIGFLFPKAIIVNYGSTANGLITSLQQFIQYFTLLEAGLSGAAVFALYKPLAEKDQERIEKILYSAKKFYSRTGRIFVACIIVISFVYPFFIADTGYPKIVVTMLFCLMGLNGATQLLFIGKYKVLLNASQKNRYVAMLNAFSTCLYSVVIIIAAYCRLPLLLAITLGVLAYVVRAIAYHIVVKKNFPQFDFAYSGEVYKFNNQREVFIQQLLSLLILNSSIFILSFSKTSMSEISVFTVYNMVLTTVFIVTNAVNTGVSASFGDLIARNEIERLQKAYIEYETLFQVFWTVIFSCVTVLYQPFISLYTVDFNDASYLRPSLCIMFSLLGGVWVIRNQQSVIIVAAGRFKEIQRGSIIEAVLTMILSTVGLLVMGLEGLLLGRIISASYRMIDFIRYCSKEVLKFNLKFTIKQIIISTCVICLTYLIVFKLQQKNAIETYFNWVVFACITVVISLALSLLINTIFNRDQVVKVLRSIKKKTSKGL